jgi:hypothetical protein
MTLYSEFDPEEQRLLRGSLEYAAVYISASSPGRSEETVSEGVAAATTVLGSRAEYLAYPLIESVIQALEERAKREERFPDYSAVARAPGAKDEAAAALRAVVALLDARATPEEAAAYKRWLLSIATAVAEAGKEDQGFLGRGGVLVNDAERAALAELATLLGVSGA